MRFTRVWILPHEYGKGKSVEGGCKRENLMVTCGLQLGKGVGEEWKDDIEKMADRVNGLTRDSDGIKDCWRKGPRGSERERQEVVVTEGHA